MFFGDFHSQNSKIGFVPTMGALHQGHLSLVKKSSENNDITTVSIFVNPLQFNNKKDLENYPKRLNGDLSLLKTVSCDVVFVPSVEEIYANSVAFNCFDFDGLDAHMEGKYRKNHFQGVGTVVKKLFEIILPTRAYFGEKDFQQLQIIKKMAAKMHPSITVVGCATHREENGLAMSSRNELLSSAERHAASMIYNTLKKVAKKIHSQSITDIKKWVSAVFEEHPLFTLEYFEIADEESLESITLLPLEKQARAFVAVHVGAVKLIDNILLTPNLP